MACGCTKTPASCSCSCRMRHGFILSDDRRERPEAPRQKAGSKDGLFFIIGGPIDPAKMTFVGGGLRDHGDGARGEWTAVIAAGDKDNLVKVAKALREVPSYKKAPFRSVPTATPGQATQARKRG